MTQPPISSSRFSESELARLRASYLRQNQMRFSFPLVIRAIATLVFGTLLAAVVMVATGHLISGMIPREIWKTATGVISGGIGVGLMIRVYKWDDRKRFEAFLASHQAGGEGSAVRHDIP